MIICFSKRAALVSAMVYCLTTMPAIAAESDHFRKYNYPEEGFEISFPSKPLQFRTETKVGHSNSYQALVANPVSQYSVFVQHSPDKVFSEDSIDGYLNGLIRGLITGFNNSELTYKNRTRLVDFPAIEYQFTGTNEGEGMIARGIILMVDGNHIRLSQLSTPADPGAGRDFQKFVSSFRITPIDIPLSSDRFDDKPRGIAFSPPAGWKQDTTKFAQIPAIFASPTRHMVQIIDSSSAGYSCDNYRGEIEGGTGIQASGTTMVRGRSMTWIKSPLYHPSSGTHMTGIHFCLNTSRGAVILNGLAPKESFIRSEKIFHKVAASLVVRK